MRVPWAPLVVAVAFVASLVVAQWRVTPREDYTAASGVVAKVDTNGRCGVMLLDNGGVYFLGSAAMSLAAVEAMEDGSTVYATYDYRGYVAWMEWTKNNGGGVK